MIKSHFSTGLSLLSGMLLWGIALVLLAPALAAQNPAALREEIETLARSIEADSGLAEDVLSELRGICAQARSIVDLEEKWISSRAKFENERLIVPQVLESLRLELDRPSVPPRLDIEWSTQLSEVEVALEIARSELASIRTASESMDSEQLRMATRRPELPQAIAAARQALRDAETQLSAPLPESTGALQGKASQLLLRAKVASLQAELASHEEELRFYDASVDVVAVRRRLQDRRITEATALVQAWMKQAEERRERKTRKAAREAEAAARMVDKYSGELRLLAEHNSTLANRVSSLALRLEQLGRLHAETSKAYQEVREAQEAATRREKAGGLSDAVGTLLRKEKAELPPARVYERRALSRRDEMASVRLEQIQYEEEIDELSTERVRVVALLQKPEESSRSSQQIASSLFSTRQRYLEDLIRDCEADFVQLAALEQEERLLVGAARGFENFIDERILWIPSSPPVWKADFSDLPGLGRWLISAESWNGVVGSFWADARAHPGRLSMIGLLLGGLFLLRPRLRRVLASVGEESRRRSCLSMKPTWKALGATLVLIVAYPAVLWVIGWRLSSSVSSTEFAKALGVALISVSLLLLVVNALRNVYRTGGLAEAHFSWSESLGEKLRLPLFLVLVTVLPMLGFAMFLEGQDNESWQDGAGRTVLAAAFVIFAIFLFRLMRDHRRKARTTGWARVWILGQMAGLLVPGALATLALGGYYFTAVQLLDRVLLTSVVVILVSVLYGVAARGLLLAKRRLAISQAKKLRAARAQAEGESFSTIDEDQAIDLAVVDSQTRQVLSALLGIAVVAGAWMIWSDVLPALNFLDRVELWSYSEEVVVDGEKVARQQIPVTLAGLLMAVTILASTFLANRNLPSVLEVSILQRLPIGPGERYAIKAVLRYVVILVGLIWAFAAIGIGWSKVQWLVAAVSVGLGFGLQEIFANFVSGLIILGERPVRVGDWVTVGEVTGKVNRIHMRATTLIDRDLREWLIPNKEFITGKLSNWTLSDPMTRVVAPVGIAYGSNTEEAARILGDVARSTPNVLESPPPSVVFMGFGDNSLELELRFFISGRDLYPAILDPVNTRVHREFAAAGIEIAFPQRDLHIRSAEGLSDFLGGAGRKGPLGDSRAST